MMMEVKYGKELCSSLQFHPFSLLVILHIIFYQFWALFAF